VVASQVAGVLEALGDGVVSLAQVNTVWPDWLRLAKAFTDSYEVDAARALGAVGSLADPDQVDAAVLGPLEREYLATLTLFLDMYRQHREEGSQEVVSFRDRPQPKDAGLEHVVAGWGAGGTTASPTLTSSPVARACTALRAASPYPSGCVGTCRSGMDRGSLAGGGWTGPTHACSRWSRSDTGTHC
jgi:hypothetical protein